MKKYIAIIFSLFLLNGCGPSLKETMATWEGDTMSDAIMAWGVPDRSSEIAGGVKKFTLIICETVIGILFAKHPL